MIEKVDNMARKNDAQSATAGQSSPIMMVLQVLLIGVMALNTYLLWDTRNIAATASVAGGHVEPEAVEPVFLNIAPFTVNLASDQYGPRLLYAGLTLELPSEKMKELLTKNMPQVRNRLLVLLSGQQAEQIAKSEGKKTLASNIAKALSEPYSGDEEILINDVLFTEFIVQ